MAAKGLYIVLRLYTLHAGLILAMKQALHFKSPNGVNLAEAKDDGLLIAFEGPDGSDKTTQRRLFTSWLRNVHQDVIVTKWNSSPLFKPLIKAGKEARSLDPESYAFLHAADFWH